MEVLQTSALPLGYGAKIKGDDGRQFTGSPPRAGNGTRTRDPNLGKVVLYQLSYSRMGLESRSSVPATTSDGSGSPSQNARWKLEIHREGVKPPAASAFPLIPFAR